MEGIDVILERARQRVARNNSNADIFSDIPLTPKNEGRNSFSTSSPLIPHRKSSFFKSNRNINRPRKVSRLLESYKENDSNEDVSHKNDETPDPATPQSPVLQEVKVEQDLTKSPSSDSTSQDLSSTNNSNEKPPDEVHESKV